MIKEKRDHSFGSLAERPKPSDFVARLDRAGNAHPREALHDTNNLLAMASALPKPDNLLLDLPVPLEVGDELVEAF